MNNIEIKLNDKEMEVLKLIKKIEHIKGNNSSLLDICSKMLKESINQYHPYFDDVINKNRHLVLKGNKLYLDKDR